MSDKKKRNLFEELKQGIQEVKYHKAGKITLRTHKVKKYHPSITPDLILNTRKEIFHMSRPVFALKLGIPERTLEKWEQGGTKPNGQAAALILLVRQYPDIINKIEKVLKESENQPETAQEK